MYHIVRFALLASRALDTASLSALPLATQLAVAVAIVVWVVRLGKVGHNEHNCLSYRTYPHGQTLVYKPCWLDTILGTVAEKCKQVPAVL